LKKVIVFIRSGVGIARRGISIEKGFGRMKEINNL